AGVPVVIVEARIEQAGVIAKELWLGGEILVDGEPEGRRQGRGQDDGVELDHEMPRRCPPGAASTDRTRESTGLQRCLASAVRLASRRRAALGAEVQVDVHTVGGLGAWHGVEVDDAAAAAARTHVAGARLHDREAVREGM